MPKSWSSSLALLLWLISIAYCCLIPEQSDFVPLVGGLIVAAGVYYYICFKEKAINLTLVMAVAIIARLIATINFPNLSDDIFRFIWDGAEEEAKMLTRKSDEFVKFAWEENDDDSFFEMRIIVDEITKDVSLFITDFAEEDEIDEAKMLWENQIGDLKQVLGSA